MARVRLRFRYAQLLVLLAVLSLAVSAVGIVAYLNARYSTRDLTSQLLAHARGEVTEYTQVGLRLAETQGAILADKIAAGLVAIDDPEPTLAEFDAVMRVQRGMSYMSLTLPDGSYWHVHRRSDASLVRQVLLPRADGRFDVEEFAEQDGGWVSVGSHVAPSDPRQRPYYTAAIEAGVPTWTPAYVFVGDGRQADVPGTSWAVPIYRDEDLIAVLTSDISVATVANFLAQMQMGGEGMAVILERSPEEEDDPLRVVGHPNPALLSELDTTTGVARVTHVSTFGDIRVRALGEALTPRMNDAWEDGIELFFDIPGDRYLASCQPVRGQNAPEWITCALLPESEVMRRISRINLYTAGIAVVSLLVAAVLAMMLAGQVSAPISRLVERASAIGRFHVDASPPLETRIEELAELSNALEDMKTGLRSFRKFVPAELVRSVVASGQEATLGGERREVTVFFSDIAGFTSISEALAPERLVELLADYLGAVTTQILERKGTVDKYIGDAVMAFWNAPTPCPDHPLAACEAALANQARIAELNETFVAKGLPPLTVRIGIHTGEVIVGTIGSHDRLDYTVLGDTVNLGSRLEGLNKSYGTLIMISETTRLRVGDAVVARPLDRVAVKGKAKGIVVHELVALDEAATDAQREMCRQYAVALQAYFERDFEAATAGFEAVLSACPDDGPSKVMLSRIRAYGDHSPASDWDGIHHMKTK